ncbi:BrnA antitoxin family protein [Sinorhizobium fredii]|uniref:BrnA antitoxin family protein n=1 Tax=Rhizobium fredii TaxID=380 RepID=UPI003513EA82
MTNRSSRIGPISDKREAEIQRKIASDPDAPEATDEQIAQAMPFAEAFPDLAESIKRARGRPPVENPRRQISIRLDPDVIEHYKKNCGKRWQSRINDDLRRAAGLRKGKGLKKAAG